MGNLCTNPPQEQANLPTEPTVSKSKPIPKQLSPRVEEVNTRQSDRKSTTKKKHKIDISLYVSEINSCRTNPSEYARKVMDHMNFVEEDGQGGFVYTNGDISQPLLCGPDRFQEVAKKLKALKPLDPVQFNEELSLEVDTKEQKINDKDVIADIIQNKKKELAKEGKIRLERAFIDLSRSVLNPEICILLILVDDRKFKFYRYESILWETAEYVGILVKKQKTKGLLFVSFGAPLDHI